MWMKVCLHDFMSKCALGQLSYFLTQFILFITNETLFIYLFISLFNRDNAV